MPAMTSIVLRLIAEENLQCFPEVSAILIHNVYMDDVCCNIPAENDLKHLLGDIKFEPKTDCFCIK